MQTNKLIMEKNKQVKSYFSISKLLLVCLSLAVISCTKYTGKTSTTTTTTSGGTTGTAPTPLPPLATGGGTSSGGTTGGGTANANIPQAFVQGFSFTDFSGYYININDYNT